MTKRIAVAALMWVLIANAAGPVKPADESRRFPKANLVKTELVERQIMGKAFLPGGTLAHYKKAKVEYQMFAAKLDSPTAAAIALSDYRKTLKNPVLVPSFGGYFGDEAGKPLFVFTKSAWVLGVKGLTQKEADLQARVLAGPFQ